MTAPLTSMLRFLFNMATVVSAILLAGVVVAWFRSYRVADTFSWSHQNSSDYRFAQVGSSRGGVLIVVASGTLAVKDANWLAGFRHRSRSPDAYPFIPARRFAGSVQIRGAGFYVGTNDPIGVNDWANQGRACWVVLPLWSLASLSALLPLIGSVRWVRRRRRLSRGGCLTCGYDLRASANRCPECGTAIVNPAPAPARASGGG